MSDLIPWHAPLSGWIVLSTLAAGGVAIIAFALFRRRGAIDPSRCPRCDYDIRFSSGSICSECGQDRKAMPRVRVRRWWWVAAGLILIFALPIYVVHRRLNQFGWQYYQYVGPLYFMLPPITVLHAQMPGYDLRIIRDRRDLRNPIGWQTTYVLCNGKKIIDLAGGEAFGWPADPGVANSVAVGPMADLDGDGIPELIVRIDRSFACPLLRPLKLCDGEAYWQPLQSSSMTNSQYGQPAECFCRDPGGTLFLRVTAPYYQWDPRFGQCPHPRVLLGFQRGHFVTLVNRMREPPPSTDTMDALVAACLGEPTLAASTLQSKMADLLYAGHAAEADALLNRAWHWPIAKKTEFQSVFDDYAVRTPYSQEVAQLGYPAEPRSPAN